jgi:hypothetical protein
MAAHNARPLRPLRHPSQPCHCALPRRRKSSANPMSQKICTNLRQVQPEGENKVVPAQPPAQPTMASADIRYAAAALNKELAKNHESLVNDPKALLSLIQRNQELGRQAKKSSDAAFLLGNDTRMAGLVAVQAKRLTSYMKATPATFMKELMKKFPSASGEGVDWVQFGIKTSSYTREPPTGGDLFHLCVCVRSRARARSGAHGRRAGCPLLCSAATTRLTGAPRAHSLRSSSRKQQHGAL